jgi:hypothetical protein
MPDEEYLALVARAKAGEPLPAEDQAALDEEARACLSKIRRTGSGGLT